MARQELSIPPCFFGLEQWQNIHLKLVCKTSFENDITKQAACRFCAAGHRTCYFYSFQALEELLSSSKPGFLLLGSNQNSVDNAFKRQTPTSKTGTPVSISGIYSLWGQQMPVPCSYSFDAQEMRDNLDFRSGNLKALFTSMKYHADITVLQKVTYSNQLPLNYLLPVYFNSSLVKASQVCQQELIKFLLYLNLF